MRRSLRALFRAAALVGFATVASDAALAQQKTVKQCTDEWRANKTENQAKGITESAYVKQCRAGTAAAQPTAAPAPKAGPAAAAPTKTAKQCADEWRANKAANQAKGLTERAYVKDCRAGTLAAQPAAAPAPAQPPQAAPAQPAQAAPAPARTARPTAPAPRATTAVAPAGNNQFAAEAQAKARCPADVVVWVNTDSNIYHFSGHSDYGHTKQGAFMCEKDAMAAGNRAAKNEKHP
jgi:hypothetical protein